MPKLRWQCFSAVANASLDARLFIPEIRALATRELWVDEEDYEIHGTDPKNSTAGQYLRWMERLEIFTETMELQIAEVHVLVPVPINKNPFRFTGFVDRITIE